MPQRKVDMIWRVLLIWTDSVFFLLHGELGLCSFLLGCVGSMWL